MVGELIEPSWRPFLTRVVATTSPLENNLGCRSWCGWSRAILAPDFIQVEWVFDLSFRLAPWAGHDRWLYVIAIDILLRAWVGPTPVPRALGVSPRIGKAFAIRTGLTRADVETKGCALAFHCCKTSTPCQRIVVFPSHVVCADCSHVVAVVVEDNGIVRNNHLLWSVYCGSSPESLCPDIRSSVGPAFAAASSVCLPVSVPWIVCHLHEKSVYK
jgi:hypothetical protein